MRARERGRCSSLDFLVPLPPFGPLRARARKGPLLLLIDEAHTLDLHVGRALLNAGQQIGRALPFLLVLAGTPILRARLNAMNATFWNRAERRPVGRLDGPATAAAVRNPLRSEGIDVDDDALAHVVRDSHGYPYFVQLWGRAVWRQAAADASRRVTPAAVAAAQGAVDREKEDYYLDRYPKFNKIAGHFADWAGYLDVASP